MSIEKVAFTKVTQEKTPYTILVNKVIQNITDYTAGFIWVYLSSLPQNWQVNIKQLCKHFNMGEQKLRKHMAFLNKCHLLEYVYNRDAAGQILEVTINVLNGDKYTEESLPGNDSIHLVENPLSGESPTYKRNKNIKIKINNPPNAPQKGACVQDDSFDKFWTAYTPKKGNKAKCRKRWYDNGLDKLADVIMAKLAKQQATDRQYVQGFAPHPYTYINGKRWEDDIEPVNAPKPQQPHQQIPRQQQPTPIRESTAIDTDSDDYIVQTLQHEMRYPLLASCLTDEQRQRAKALLAERRRATPQETRGLTKSLKDIFKYAPAGVHGKMPC